MTLNFAKIDSFYKIYSTIEKIPDHKKVTINIHSENQFFKNTRRGKQLLEILQKKHIDYKFQTYSDKEDEYLDSIGAIYENQQKKTSIITKTKNIGKLIYMFLFRIKDFQLWLVSKQNISKYVIIGLEAVALCLIVYIIYIFMIPSATIYISPSYNHDEIVYNFRYYPPELAEQYSESKNISIEYQKGSITIDRDLNTNVKNLRYITSPARGSIKLYNTSNRSVPLKPNTKFITEDGLLFKTPNRVEIKAGTPNKPSETTVFLESMDQDNRGNIIGQRGNISAGKKFYIKNLAESNNQKRIWGISIDNFSGGTTDSRGNITSIDIQNFKEQITALISGQKKEILRENVQANDQKKPLLYSDLIQITPVSRNIKQKIGDNSPIIGGKATFRIDYIYIYHDDLIQASRKYFDSRPNDTATMIDIDLNSVTWFEKKNISTGVYSIPTRLNSIWGYNFSKDISEYKKTSKEKILGLSIQDAKDIILENPDIGSVDIKLSPFWLENIPTIESNIDFVIKYKKD